MKISCQSCQAKYTIADEKVLGKIVKIRCKKCGATIVINGNESGAQTGGSQSGAEAQAFDYAALRRRRSVDGQRRGRRSADDDARRARRGLPGVVTDDTYCWKDGMADWLPIREIPELYSAATSGSQAGGNPDQTQQEQPNAGAYPTPPPQHDPDEATASGYSGYGAPASAAAAAPPSTNGNGVANGLFGSSPAPAPAAARRQGGRGGGAADLFGNVAQAGGEDDVMTSAPAGMPQASGDPGKLTGQRNENSVLFSLNALTQNAPKEEAPQAPGAEGSGLIDIRALSASMGEKTSDKRSHVDDIMNLGGGGAFSADQHAPLLGPPKKDGVGLDASGQPLKDNTKMMLIAIIGAGFLIALAIVLVVLLKKPAEPRSRRPIAATDRYGSGCPATASATAPTATAPRLRAAAAAATDRYRRRAASAERAATTALTTAAARVAAAVAHRGGGGGSGRPAPFVPPAPAAQPARRRRRRGAKSLADALKASAGGGDSTPAPAAQSSAAPFDRGAAAAALGSVSVGGCKKSDGPTGSGHVSITFAPSGNVQSAVVDQPPFAGTAVGGCVAGKFRGAHIPAFSGAAVHVGKSFTID